MMPAFSTFKPSLIAGFHNSLTILTSELEGRTYGGGVLEMVPSEIAKLVVPIVQLKPHLATLDKVCRDAGGQLDSTDTLIDATDELLAKAIPDIKPLLPTLRSARDRMRNRRFFG